MRRAFITALIGLSAVILLESCCAHRFDRPEGPTPSIADALTRIQARADKLQSFEMISRLQLFGDGDRLKGKVEILGKRPGLLRFEALTPSDDTLALLATDGERFTSHERGSPECRTGPACPANVARLVPIALEPAALFDALTGGAFAFDGDAVSFDWDECEGTWLLIRKGPAGAQRVWLRPDDLGAVRVEVEIDGRQVLRIDYDDAATEDGVLVPRLIRVLAPDRDVELEIRASQLYLNGIVDEEPFGPECPAGTRVIELPCDR